MIHRTTVSRLSVLAVILTLLLSLWGCGDAKKTKDNDSNKKPAATSSVVSEAKAAKVAQASTPTAASTTQDFSQAQLGKTDGK